MKAPTSTPGQMHGRAEEQAGDRQPGGRPDQGRKSANRIQRKPETRHQDVRGSEEHGVQEDAGSHRRSMPEGARPRKEPGTRTLRRV